MIIYVDVIFLENMILDFIILLATTIISNNKFCIFRLLLGSLIGSTYTICSFILEINNLFIKIILSIIIVLICFGYTNKRKFLKNIGVFYLTAVTFGGSAFMFLFLVNPNKVNFRNGYFVGFYPIVMAILRRSIWLFLNYICSKNAKKKI